MIMNEGRELRIRIIEKLFDLSEKHKLKGRFSITRFDYTNKELDLMYNSETIGTLYFDDFVFSDKKEVSKPMANLLWELCIYLQRHYGRGAYSGSYESKHKPVIQWNEDGSMKLEVLI